MDDNRLVPRDSAVYQEFARLYQLARTLRPTGADRWNGDLHATSTKRWGAFNPKTGAIRLSELDVLQYLTGSTFATSPRQQAQALATGPARDDPCRHGGRCSRRAERRPFRSFGGRHGGGFAELRTVEDFRAFTSRAGYPGLTLEEPQYPGAYAATESLMAQVAGPRLSREAIIDAGTQGPVVMHFDLLTEGVVRNRLGDVVPDRAGDRGAVRAALIETMTHAHWPTLPDRSARTGEAVAEDIRRGLNAKVDEIRRHYQANPTQPFPADSPNPESTRAAVPEIPTNAEQNRTDQPAAGATQDRADQPAAGADLINLPPPAADTRVDAPLCLTTMRFLSGQAPAAQAIRQAPSLADGSRGAGSPQVPGAARTTPSRPGLPTGTATNEGLYK